MLLCSVQLCTYLTAVNYFQWLYTTFDGYILLTTFGGYILVLTAMYYFWQLYTTFDAINYFYLYLTAILWELRTFLIPKICELKASLEFNINLLTLIQFCFLYRSVVTLTNFNWPFWRCCFIRNTQMLKMWNLLHLTLQMVHKTSKSTMYRNEG